MNLWYRQLQNCDQYVTRSKKKPLLFIPSFVIKPFQNER